MLGPTRKRGDDGERRRKWRNCVSFSGSAGASSGFADHSQMQPRRKGCRSEEFRRTVRERHGEGGIRLCCAAANSTGRCGG